MVRILVVITLFFFTPVQGKNIILLKTISIDATTYYENGACENCIRIINQAGSSGKHLYFQVTGKNTLLKYDVSRKRFTETIIVTVDSIKRMVPFYVDENENIYAFAIQRHQNSLIRILKDRTVRTYSLTGAWIKDSFNIGYHAGSSYVDRNGRCYLNILREYTPVTAPRYYEEMAGLAAVGAYDISGQAARVNAVPFFNPHPDGKSRSLVSNLLLFDVSEDEHMVYFQNRCIDTIYGYNYKTGKVTRVGVSGSGHKLIPHWYDPGTQDKADVQLLQNMAGAFFVMGKKNRIYRQVSAHFPDGTKFVLQVLDLDGKVLAEQILDTRYGALYRLGDQVVLSARNKGIIELYKISL